MPTAVQAGLPMMLTPKQVADQLGCGKTKVFELLRAEAIKSVLIDGMRRVKRADFEAYVDGLEPTPVRTPDRPVAEAA